MGMLARFLDGAPPPTRLWLTRAGPVENPHGVLYSHPGLPLALEGLRAFEALAERLAEHAPAHVYAPDSRAEAEAARLLAERLGAPYTLEPALRERAWGTWEGLDFATVRRRWPELVERWKRDEAGFAPPGGESLEDVRRRARPLLEELRDRHPGEAVLIVGNCTVNRIALQLALPFLPLAQGLRFEQNYAELTELRFYGADGVLARLNG
ncbi:Phosphoglycerate mutase [Oceanithermus profundus DSM 14977]|uniref:Phosphoglycerate mutase n=1 Tax=Oceanithermus profundus (strain DSM 14977 / NBRC 100410 / VKM B-2274 / 506) TaxID=670487 RepID=E4U729_OCEP5|nr:histidine phosphatase family protein [Oceanithermus profundus]ADR36032.1 Phosphoglycerate mutase [Oceanithermus profundus DSM 14977]